MSSITWMKPIEFRTPTGGKISIAGPFEALVWLIERWPNRRGLHYISARSACRAAIAGRKSPEEARKHFDAAIKEAELKA